MHASHVPDTDLLKQLKTGSDAAFSQIYNRYCPRLHKTALRILNDDELAKDVAQEAFIALFEKVKYSSVGNIEAYLFQVVKFQCFMHLRSGKISEKHLSRITAIRISNELEQELDAKELQGIIDKSIATLPDKCRQVFYLSRIESLSNKKIAEKMNISSKTVENQITKALKHLHMSVDKLVMIGFLIVQKFFF